MNDFPVPDPLLRAVVFDLDGLMFDTEVLYQEVGSTVLARRGCEFTAELLDQMMGRQSAKALQIMIDYHGLDITVPELADESMEVMRELLETRLTPMPGLLTLLDALEAAEIPKGIATSSTRDFLDHVLLLANLTDRFRFTLSGDDIEHGKPAPDVYLLAAEKHNCQPAEILVLEDSQLGCQAAVAAGAYTVAVPGGHSLTHVFPGAKFIADSLVDNRIYRALNIATDS
ncbi:HAD family hydrolase [Bythopirellula goksoeyrii]|uniref:Phosphorylated carbohydrates phosphatase n=1 Tax=Bythopirellula goksoeyrii TaxID=1400387 RepID=A0A5B9Q6K4_9BACT|nr:HAD family phosphatase [Bythopirellula goksoeyrii]QEG34627.1 Phosphorylated carbohydrates phosphatase [Bythopirellula goksoeyrii]